MSLITIQREYGSAIDIPTHHLRAGESRTFGRGVPGEAPVDIPLAPEGDSGVPRNAGIIEAAGSYWLISNTSRTQTYVVQHTQRHRGFVQISPGEIRMPIAFELSRVTLQGRSGAYIFLVLAPDHPIALAEPPAGRTTEHPVTLDQASRYFQVLVALCEPLLDEHARTAGPPSAREVARRLNIRTTTVNGQLDYLVNRKFPMLQQLRHGSGMDWRTRALVEYVLEFRLVTAEHLSVLPARQ